MKELNPKSMKALSALTREKLQEELKKVEAALFLTKMKHVSHELKQVHLISQYRQYRAQILTCLQDTL